MDIHLNFSAEQDNQEWGRLAASKIYKILGHEILTCFGHYRPISNFEPIAYSSLLFGTFKSQLMHCRSGDSIGVCGPFVLSEPPLD